MVCLTKALNLSFPLSGGKAVTGILCVPSQDKAVVVKREPRSWGKTEVSCATCGMELVTEDQLLRHRCGTIRSRYSCSYCHFSCNDRLEHTLHQSQHLRERPFSCAVCGKAFARNSDRNRHVKIHTGVRPFQCDVCSRKFRQSWHLQYHRSTHGDP